MTLHILIVEDNADTRFLLGYLLGQGGHIVHEADSVEGARRVLASQPIDVLVSDIGLPDGSGYELMTAVKAMARPPFAIAMSGFGAPADVDASAAAGFRRHLLKPIEIADLEALLEEARAERAP